LKEVKLSQVAVLKTLTFKDVQVHYRRLKIDKDMDKDKDKDKDKNKDKEKDKDKNKDKDKVKENVEDKEVFMVYFDQTNAPGCLVRFKPIRDVEDQEQNVV
jgi:hypothetical protein